MTAKEALKILDEVSNSIKESTELGQALEIALVSIEKQIPKKVIFEEDGEVLLCPLCNFDLMGSISDPDHDPYYCFECGQALDWGKEEE